MSSPRQAPSPLRDRILSNSPRAWNENNTTGRESPDVSPLRISKRDSPLRRPPPTEVARRNSSSFKHVTRNNLVTKSPFKSQIPTAATPTTRQFPSLPSPARRVSGEKRPRPQSIHDQAEAENDRPFAYKRERRQSKTFQGLLQKEVVTKSPFRQQEGYIPHDPPPVLPVPPTPSRIPVPSTAGPSPGRSSLVSRRMHGPRLSGRRERRKTVTFDERCDVVEFDRDEDPSDESADYYGGDGDGDEDNTPDGSDPFFAPQPQQEASIYPMQMAPSSPDTPMPLALQLDADTSISGLVDAMFAPVSGTSTPPPQQPQQFGSSHTRTFELPPLDNSQDIDHATDLDTEDGVPFGRSHHAARAAAFHEHAVHPPPVPQPHLTPSSSGSRPLPRPDLRAADTTPPRPHASDNIDRSTPPLGRTTHFERRLAAHEEEYDDVVDADVSHLPGSPSPAPTRHTQSDLVEIGLPRFSLPSGGGANADDPFALPKLKDEPLPDVGEDSRDVSISVRTEADAIESQDSQQSLNSSGGRPRISREEVAKRLRARSASPEVEQQPTDDAMDEDQVAYESASEGQSRDEMQDEDEFREEREEEARFEQQRHLERERVEERSATASIITTASINTEMEMEVGTVEVAERVTIPAPVLAVHSPHSPIHDRHDNNQGNTELGLRAPDLGLDFGSRFGLGGLDIPGLGGSVGSRISATSGLSTGTAERRELERVAVDMEMRSALDQLIDDVGGGQVDVGDDSVRTEEAENSLRSDEAVQAREHTRMPMRAATDSALLQMGVDAGLSRQVSVASSSSLLSLPPPPVPPKDNIRSREQMIIEKRREMRRFEEEGYDYVPPPAQDSGLLRAGNGRPSARRSMSTGDVEELTRTRGKDLLDIGAGDGDLLGQSIEQELSKREEPHKQKKYQIREHERMIYASSSDNISHMDGAGDVNTGKAWKTVRRPSDMNEYSKQIKEYRAQQNPGKAYGKVFVKVLGVRGMHLPLPAERTAMTCTLNNGIHFVTTPECALARDCRIEQEFELIEHTKLEFTLTLKVRRDPHIISQFKAVTPTAVPVPKAVAPAPPPVVQQTSSKGGLRSFWSPKKNKEKNKEKTVAAPPPPPPQAPAPMPPQIRLPENLARYLKPDGTLARVFVAFKDVAARCDTRLFETSYPLIGQRTELGGKASTLQVGELVLQMFWLPPLPGVPPEELPQSLDECHRGLRHINWHKVTYFQGTLTQNGGDCSSWRRRQLRVIGANLVAFNDVTKKATATIDLKKAVAVEDNQEARGAMSPASGMTGRSSRYDEYDALYGVERSFRLVFPNDQEIMFFADTDEEKTKWLEVLRALVGHIPPHPLWAELLWQRQDELSKQSRLKST
ncbi:PH domain-containing protein [Mycena sanguinolenta]|uniref:PH domain-containing protein n=1 Tax=Mycena sanguinolenta TaxID=230812 RepID=A0A8H6ZHW7_9AGAR|nr:PH domain-containing protein [Mycena sanguinolenta]